VNGPDGFCRVVIDVLTLIQRAKKTGFCGTGFFAVNLFDVNVLSVFRPGGEYPRNVITDNDVIPCAVIYIHVQPQIIAAQRRSSIAPQMVISTSTIFQCFTANRFVGIT
jgi:hypothetical protein